MSARTMTTLNEKDSLQDMLNIEKELVKMYGMAMTESEAQKFRSLLKTNWQQTTATQFQIFEQMKQQGYYQTAPADKTVMDQKRQTFKEVSKDLKS